jgi:hypothetical protein
MGGGVCPSMHTRAKGRETLSPLPQDAAHVAKRSTRPVSRIDAAATATLMFSSIGSHMKEGEAA